MRYELIINNDEWNEDDDCSFENVRYEVAELLRSGYINVELFAPADDA